MYHGCRRCDADDHGRPMYATHDEAGRILGYGDGPGYCPCCRVAVRQVGDTWIAA